jgi:hypothetical protein
MAAVSIAILTSVRSSFRSRAALALEILALRHQLAVLKQGTKTGPPHGIDRLLWVSLLRTLRDWRKVAIVKPEGVIA